MTTREKWGLLIGCVLMFGTALLAAIFFPMVRETPCFIPNCKGRGLEVIVVCKDHHQEIFFLDTSKSPDQKIISVKWDPVNGVSVSDEEGPDE